MNFEFAAQSAKDPDNPWANSSRLLNWYREPVGDGNVVLKSVLGTEAFASVDTVVCRAFAEVNNRLYAVVGDGFYQIGAGGSDNRLGTIPLGGDVSISGHKADDMGDKVTVCASGRFFVWDGSSLVEPASGAFSAFGGVEFFGQRTILTEKDGRRVQWSDLADPLTLGGLDFATTETSDDNNIRPLNVAGSLWVFKQRSIEKWYNNPGTGAPANYPGSTMQVGLRSFHLVTKTPNGCFFVGSDGIAYLVQGQAMQRVSTIAVETSIKGESPQRAFYFEDEGHKFCALRYPDRPAWVFDIGTFEWHERQEGTQAWSAIDAAQAYGSHFVCTNEGDIHKLTHNGKDESGPLIRQAQGRTVAGGAARFRVPHFELECTTGVNQVIQLRTSNDKGRTWSDPKTRSLGPVGNYRAKAIWRALGHFDDFTAEVSYSGESPVTIGTKAVGRFA